MTFSNSIPIGLAPTAASVSVAIGDLFMAGAVPGLMLATFYGLFTLVRCYINPSLAPTAEEVEKARGKEMKLSKEKYQAVLLSVFLIACEACVPPC